MAQSTSASDSENSASTPHAKGLVQIVLGTAAGAFVASRMNRGALLLTAGLAYTLWKKGQKSPAAVPSSRENTSFTPPEEEPSVEATRAEEVIPAPAMISTDANSEVPEIQETDPSSVESLPAIQPVASLPHVAPFLLLPVVDEPAQQTDPEVKANTEPASPAVDLDSTLPTAEESKNQAPESQEFSAWEELRAALAPTYPSAPAHTDLNADAVAAKSQQATEEPQHLMPSFESVTFSEPPTVLEAPPMIELSVCQPSSPLIHTPFTEGVDIPDEIQLPEPVEESVTEGEDFLLDQPKTSEPSEGVNLTSKPIPVIIPRQDIKFTTTVASQPPLPDEAESNSLSAPVVIPRDVQAKKSFFDWLRG